MRIADGVMAVLFVFSAAVQFNDPDPLGWVAIYSAAAGVTAWGALHGFPRGSGGVVGCVALAWLVGLGAAHFNELGFAADVVAVAMKNEATEVVREIGGLTIVAGWMLPRLAMARDEVPQARGRRAR